MCLCIYAGLHIASARRRLLLLVRHFGVFEEAAADETHPGVYNGTADVTCLISGAILLRLTQCLRAVMTGINFVLELLCIAQYQWNDEDWRF